jgi:hypothetical protein
MALPLRRRPATCTPAGCTPTYIGKDADGNNVTQNLFFAGSGGDAVNLLGQIMEKGPVGVGTFFAGKFAPFTRLGMHILTGKNGMGRDIAAPDLSLPAKIGRYLALIVADLSPLPLSIRNAYNAFFEDQASPTVKLRDFGLGMTGPQVQHATPFGYHRNAEGELVETPQRDKPTNPLLKQIMTGRAHPTRREMDQ